MNFRQNEAMGLEHRGVSKRFSPIQLAPFSQKKIVLRTGKTHFKVCEKLAAMRQAFDVNAELHDVSFGWFGNKYDLVVTGPERNVKNFESAIQQWPNVDYQ